MSVRGNSLMVTMIALAVLMVLVVGAIRFTGTNREAAVSKVRGDRLAACADTARRYLLSRLRVFGVSVTDLRLEGAVNQPNFYALLPDDAVDAQKSRIGAAHYGTEVTSITASTQGVPSAVAIVPSSQIGSTGKMARDMANAAPSTTTLGGTFYRVVMKCQEPGTLGAARESEVEFVFRYGL